MRRTAWEQNQKSRCHPHLLPGQNIKALPELCFGKWVQTTFKQIPNENSCIYRVGFFLKKCKNLLNHIPLIRLGRLCEVLRALISTSQSLSSSVWMLLIALFFSFSFFFVLLLDQSATFGSGDQTRLLVWGKSAPLAFWRLPRRKRSFILPTTLSFLFFPHRLCTMLPDVTPCFRFINFFAISACSYTGKPFLHLHRHQRATNG